MIWDRKFAQYIDINVSKWFATKEIHPRDLMSIDSRIRIQLSLVKIDAIKL